MSTKMQRTMICPFNPNHIMPYDRFLNHLDKCQFPDKASFKKCQYNPYHVLHKDKLQSHYNTCPDRKKYDESDQDDDDWGVKTNVKKQETIKTEKSTVSSKYDSKNSDDQFSIVSSKVSKGSTEMGNSKKTRIDLQVQDFDTMDFGKGK